MFKYVLFFSLFLLIPFIGKNQPVVGLDCFDTIHISTISGTATYCDVTLDLGLGYDQQNCTWVTLFQALNFGGCGALLRIPFQSVDVFSTTYSCSGFSQTINLGGHVYYQWRLEQEVAGVVMTLGSGTFTKNMSNTSIIC